MMEDVVVVGGGRSGLAAAHALRAAGLAPIVLEAGAEPVGSWPHYYDSLKLFSPAAYSGIPASRSTEIRSGTHLATRWSTTCGSTRRSSTRTSAPGAASPRSHPRATADSWSRPMPAKRSNGRRGRRHRLVRQPALARPARSAHLHRTRPARGRLSPSTAIRRRARRGHQARRLSGAGRLRTSPGGQRHHRKPPSHRVSFPKGSTGKTSILAEVDRLDDLPPEWLARLLPDTLVTDTGRYRGAVESGRPDRRPMFTALEGEHVVWSDGTREAVDTIVLATGYPPTSTICARLERSPTVFRGTRGASPPRIPVWPISASSFNARTRRTPSVACTATPSTSRPPSPRTYETQAPSSGRDRAGGKPARCTFRPRTAHGSPRDALG